MPSTARSSTPVVAVAIALLVGVLAGGLGITLVGQRGAGPGAGPGADPGAGAGGGGMGGLPPATVRVGEVTEERVQDRFDIVGRLEEIRRAVVAAESEGKVIAVPVEEGQPVVAGQTVLARIDPVWAEVAVEAAEARVASARATLEQSERELQYLEELQATGSARPKEVDDARAKAKADRATLAAAEAERNEARQRFARLDVVAPFDGHVVRKLVEVGQWVEPGGDIAEVVSAGEVDALVNVPERVINEVALGDPVEVTVEPLGRRFSGAVVAVVPAADTAARTFPVKVRLDDADGLLKPGMSVLAHLPVGQATTQLTVPRDAVLFQGGKATVWAAADPPPADAAGETPAGDAPSDPAAPAAAAGGPPMKTAMPVPVEVLYGTGDRYVVRAPLTPGTPVVIEGGERLIPTQPLIVLPSEPATAGAPLTLAE